MALYAFVPVEKAREALVLLNHSLILDLDYTQIEYLHKLILMKHIQMTFVFRKALSFWKNQLFKVDSGIISYCYFGNARRGSNL